MKANESFSAFLDGEASELDIQRMLNELDEHPEKLQQWHELSKTQAVAQGETLVDAALALSDVEQPNETVTETAKPWSQRLFQGAVAAAVASVVVAAFGVMQTQQTTELPLVQIDAPVDTNSTQLAEQTLEAQQRLELYLREHAEQASFTTGHVIVPSQMNWQETDAE
ncbi:sigma-E factor negative regulatory protein [Reinekea thalattae]|uniref:Anti sigma-E protein RseA N-terminal domain-containing protein n=1 Tax=Reinekea thalattae TaxID=2593301 RepID=A0A5C8Z6Z5_9GAMM|nr:sigma-E factor negative regulatory protein [Reinekea thalattae]TXR53073.1 hypothetical protein FME95_00390 [Reinekea thalattae]